MKGWLTHKEIADFQLPGMPHNERGVHRLADREGWAARKTQKGEPLARPRAGRGGGLEYHVSLLPPEARAQLSAQAHKINTTTAPILPQPAPAATSPERVKRRDARLAILVLADAHYAANRALGRVAADADFCLRYNDGRVSAEGWLRGELARVSVPSLKRWRKERESGNWHLVGGKGRKVKSILEAANDGQVAIRIAAYLLHQPFLSAAHVRDLMEAEFGAQLLVDGHFVDLPHERSFQRFIVDWRDTNKVFITNATHPDAFKSKMRLTGSNMYAGITRVNQLWEIDASPADVLLKGGRHSIYLLTDVFSRRVMVHVSKTARTEAALLLLRKAILAWGVPETLRTDNGSDFVSEAFSRALPAIGIRQDVTAPFSPEQKAIVERVIGTMQHRFCTLLPGFVGHNVTDRKQIEDRRAFAKRLGDTDDNAFCVDVDLTDFQAYADRWAADDHAHRKHASLGMSPHEKAKGCPIILRTIDNAHALDILLAPIPSAWRVVTKRGIQFDGDFYLAGVLLPGTRVFCRQHPDDYGKLLCFEDEFTGFLCEAECASRSGASPHAVLAEARAERKRIMVDGLREAKLQAGRIKPRDMVDKVLDLKRRKAIEAQGNVVALPKREIIHSTPALVSAGEASDAMQASAAEAKAAFENLFGSLSNGNSNASSNASSGVSSGGKVVKLPETPKQRFKRALELQRVMAAGIDVDAADALWLGGYVNSDEFKSHTDMARDFGSEWLNA